MTNSPAFGGGFQLKKADVTPADRLAGKDRHGYTLEERVAWQDAQLEKLKRVLDPKVHAKLVAWCKRSNKAADPTETWPLGIHTAPCGCELLQWLLNHGEMIIEMERE